MQSGFLQRHIRFQAWMYATRSHFKPSHRALKNDAFHADMTTCVLSLERHAARTAPESRRPINQANPALQNLFPVMKKSF
jgi:hypothetical protein